MDSNIAAICQPLTGARALANTAYSPQLPALRLLLLLVAASLQPGLAGALQTDQPWEPTRSMDVERWRSMVEECAPALIRIEEPAAPERSSAAATALLNEGNAEYAHCMRWRLFEEAGREAESLPILHEERVESENGNRIVDVLFAEWDETYFDFDERVLTEAAMPFVRLLSDVLHLDVGDPVYLDLVGHTDSDGSRNYNEGLSNDRAEHVYGLLNELGAPAVTDMFYWGMGEEYAEGDTIVGKARDRKVEFVLSADSDASRIAVYQRMRKTIVINPAPSQERDSPKVAAATMRPISETGRFPERILYVDEERKEERPLDEESKP